MNYSVNTDLLIKYFSGLASPEEAFRIDTWRKEHIDHEAYFQELNASWNAEQKYIAPDVPALWQQFETTINPEFIAPKQKPKTKALKWLPYAALLILVLGLGLWQTTRQHSADTPKTQEFAYTEAAHQFEIGQGLSVDLHPGAVLKEEQPVGKGSYILNGSALFDFKQAFPDFRLRLPSGISLRHIGTQFLVEGDARSARISVYEGAVAVWYKKDTITVGKNEVLNYKTTTGFSKTALTGNFDYKDYTLQEVCDSVGRYFRSDLQIREQTLTTRRLTLSGSELNLDEVLQIITQTLDIKYDTLAKDTIVFTSH